MTAVLAPVPPPAAGPSPAPPASPAGPQVAGITPEVIDLVRRGKKIHAIKLYRELTNTDLATAKRVIDSL
jgi:ribosomal protein L7/L12